MGLQQSKIAIRWRTENVDHRESRQPQDGCVSPSQAQEKQFTRYVPMHKAALRGDWRAAESLLYEDPKLVQARITQGGEIALHIAAVEGHVPFVDNLLKKMSKSNMEIRNEKGSTALCFAAGVGNVDIARLIVDNNPNLPKIPTASGITPLYIAAARGRKDMAKYLFPLSSFESWNTEAQVALLTACIDSEIYDLAMVIADKHGWLILLEDRAGETPLGVLARKPSAFRRSNQKGWWATIASSVPRLMKLKARGRVEPRDAYGLFEFLWNKMISQRDIETGQLHEYTSKLLFIAAESGNDEFIVELIRQRPDFLYEMNYFNHSIFHIAVLHRHVQVFNLIYELHGAKDQITTYIDKDGDNILHLAAMKAPENQLNCIPGQALQMQREVLWYKEVEKIVPPSFRKMKNFNGKTPQEIFLDQHKTLMKEGEQAMKQTAKHCMLVTILIATVVFTAAFTVPGDYNNHGAPNLQNERLFLVFPISEAVATLSSLISMLMFLSILTSRYTEMDFLNSLPFWLVSGVMALFISILAMIASFCSCLWFYNIGLMIVGTLLVLFASVPIMFVILNYHLLVTILSCSYGGRWLFGSNNRLFT